jgi:hypothetical protein
LSIIAVFGEDSRIKRKKHNWGQVLNYKFFSEALPPNLRASKEILVVNLKKQRRAKDIE